MKGWGVSLMARSCVCSCSDRLPSLHPSTSTLDQVADIGLMGGPAKLDGKAVEGVKVFTGGKIGEGAELATQIEAGVAAAPEMLVPYLRDLLIREYGATLKA